MSIRSATLLTTVGLSFTRVVDAVMALQTAWERRRLVGQLGALDDHMLRDIGITRQDIASVLAEPLFRDPSLKLAERANDMRSARRDAAAAEALAFGGGTTDPRHPSPAPQRRAA